ncbi:MAG: glycosyltransferase family 39 protein [Candidatus Sulfotelmatobacter sp.]
MSISQEAGKKGEWFESHVNPAAALITLLGLLARLWAAHGTFLNPDEALHFRLANQVSLALAYKESLTAAHPPLLIVLLYYWRALGTSELWLRLPSVLAGAVFCWIFYKWLSKAGGHLAGLIGVLFVALLPPIIRVAAEVRQYSLLLAFLVSALYFLDEAFTKGSASRMAAFALCLYLAMLFHYSAFWFAAALGFYALFRIFTERPPVRVVAAWVLSQLGGVALAAFLYKTHLSKLSANDSTTQLQWLINESYLRRSFFDSAHDNPVLFLIGHTFGVFQYFFGQLAVGDAMTLLFVLAVVLLLRGKGFWQDLNSSRRLGLFLLLPFAIIGAACLAHIYPYGGTRHVAFLIIPAIAGVSVAIARLAAGRWNHGLAIAALVIAACVIFGKPRQPWMERADQSRANMAKAMDFVRKNVAPSDLIFTDYQSDLILGHYLCQQRPIFLDLPPAGFEQFHCEGYRISSTDYKVAWMLSANDFPRDWQRVVEAYSLKAGDTVWVFQAGWGVDLPDDLQKRFAEFHDLRFESFGKNIKIFKMTVGQPMPAAAPSS